MFRTLCHTLVCCLILVCMYMLKLCFLIERKPKYRRDPLPPLWRTFELTPWTKSSISQLKIALSSQTQRGVEADRHIFSSKIYSFYQTLHLCIRVIQKGSGFELYTLYIKTFHHTVSGHAIFLPCFCSEYLKYLNTHIWEVN